MINVQDFYMEKLIGKIMKKSREKPKSNKVKKKPIEPQKLVEITNVKAFEFNHISNKVSLFYFLDWVKESVPTNGSDICISLIDDYNDVCGCYIQKLEISWKEIVDNVNYDKQLGKYKKQLKKYEESIKK